MMLLAITSPLLGIGLVIVLQVFETWALGPNRPEGHSRQPAVPPTRQAPRGSPCPPAIRTDQMPLDSARGALRRHQPFLRARAPLCEAKGDVAADSDSPCHFT